MARPSAADPSVTRNTHAIEIASNGADITMRIENIPSEDDARSGRITALSVVAALRQLASPVRIGT